MNYGTFHINAIFDGVGMGSTGSFYKSRAIGVTRAKSNTGQPPFFNIKTGSKPR